MIGMENQGLMVMLANAILKRREDPSKTLRNHFGAIHQQRTLPPKRFLDIGHAAPGHAAGKAAWENSQSLGRRLLHAASKPADLELSRDRDQADLPSLRHYGYSFAFRKSTRPGRKQRQMKLPLATTWVGYRSRSGLAQALQQAEQCLQSLRPSQPQAAYARSWSELQCQQR